jgi:hypothetical protein
MPGTVGIAGGVSVLSAFIALMSIVSEVGVEYR